MNVTDNHVICTLFDHRYLARGLCMIQSARRNGFAGDIWVLSLSNECDARLQTMALPRLHIVTLGQLEAHIPGLKVAKSNRSILEYYFTCMAALHTYLFETQPAISGTMYVDSDIQFFANPEIVFESIGDAPVAITPHNFMPQMQSLECCGVYNAGWTAFRRTPEGLKCLKWWLDRSLEWCLDRVEPERYANQAYLNHFQKIAPHTKILMQKGYNCAPWNIGNYTLTEQNGRISVDGEPLIFFHFHGLKRRYGFFQIRHREYGARVSWLMRNKLYRPYIAEFLARERDQNASPGKGNVEFKGDLRRANLGTELRNVLEKLLLRPWRLPVRLVSFIQNRPIMVVGDHVI